MTLDKRSLILLTIAALSAILAAWAVRAWMSAQEQPVHVVQAAPPQPQVVSGVKVLVAARALPAGQILTEKDIKWQDWPEKGVSDNYITREGGELTSFYGAVVREALGPGEPVTDTRLVRQGDRGFLAAVLSPGLRAITIPINETNSIAGLLFPGDRVDLIVTHDVGSRRVSETVMTNIRVLAVDARTQAVEGQPGVGRTVTIEVTPKQAESVIVARGIGSFSLALRSLARPEGAPDDETGPVLAERGKTHTYDSDVSHLVGNAAGQQNVVVMRGTATSSQTFQKVSK